MSRMLPQTPFGRVQYIMANNYGSSNLWCAACRKCRDLEFMLFINYFNSERHSFRINFTHFLDFVWQGSSTKILTTPLLWSFIILCIFTKLFRTNLVLTAPPAVLSVNLVCSSEIDENHSNTGWVSKRRKKL